MGLLSLALACVAGQKTDRLVDTLSVGDTMLVSREDSASVRTSADSAVVQDTAALQQGTRTPAEPAAAAPATATQQPTPGAHRHTLRTLSPLADSIANGLVFVPRDRTWFTVASRGKRMLVDIGRYDLTLPRDSTTQAAYAEAVTRLSPLAIGTVMRLRGPWGTEDARIKGFDLWSGRIVARLDVSRTLDSLAKKNDFYPGTAIRVDTIAERAAAAAPVTPADSAARAATAAAPRVPCHRDSLSWELAARGVAVRDSMERFLADSVKPEFERMAKAARVQSWIVPGCYGLARVLVVASKRTPAMDFAAERAVVLDSLGKVIPVRVSDLRFHVHEPLFAFDADGDGIDDLAARGFGDRSGGLTIIRLDTASKRLARLASGFAWER
jgi:hypothetical protein